MQETQNKLNFVCPNCNSVNRVPIDRINDVPVCGKCNTELAPKHPIELDDNNFSKFISKSSVLVIVDFWASWCGPCRKMAPEFADASKQLSPQILLAKLSTEEAQLTASQFKIAGIPCLVAFQNGEEVVRQAGYMKSDQIVKWARSIK